MDNLPTRVLRDDVDRECPICLKKYEQDDEITTLPCCHEFHSECVTAWLNKSANCPMCRWKFRDGTRISGGFNKGRLQLDPRESNLSCKCGKLFLTIKKHIAFTRIKLSSPLIAFGSPKYQLVFIFKKSVFSENHSRLMIQSGRKCRNRKQDLSRGRLI